MSGTASPDAGGDGVSVGALAGGIAGAFVVGAILAALVMLLLARKKKKSHKVSLSPAYPFIHVHRLS